MSAVESDKMLERVKEFLAAGGDGRLYNSCEAKDKGGIRSITIYEVK